MNRGKATPWIVAGIVVVGAAATIYVMKKKASKISQESSSLDDTQAAPTTLPTNTSNTSPAPSSASGPIGKNAYVGSSGLIVRSSPEISNGFLGFGNNFVGAVNKIGALLGVVQSMESDRDGDKNPLTGKSFIWYRIKKDSVLQLPSADNYYVREDYTDLK